MRPDIIAAAVGCTSGVAVTWAGPLTTAMTRCGITNTRRVAHFLAQIGHESAGLTRLEENLNYRAARLREVWPNRFTKDSAARYAGQPAAIANRVYANRMGNGDEASGDGWRYRGRCPIQITGKDNYSTLASLTGLPLLERPDIALQPDAGALIAASWWNAGGLNVLADAGDVLAVSRRVNLGTVRTTRIPMGLPDRIERTRRAMAALGAT